MWSDTILDYQFSLDARAPLPQGISYLTPADAPAVRQVMRLFYEKYFSDSHPRIVLLGINPGRFGAGITGIPFTDPIRLQESCGIDNEFGKRQELSSLFVFEVIAAMGGLEHFYRHVYITSVCPLGFVKEGKNYNYYDDRALYQAVKPMIIDNLRGLVKSGVRTDIAFSMGKGTNFKYLEKLNQELQLFDRVEALPHPRWVMQYRLKRKREFISVYREKIERWIINLARSGP